MKKILAIGDCNTLGTDSSKGSSYPEIFGDLHGCMVQNHGFTMSTSREGLRLLKDHLTSEIDLVLIQFGLVDSYLTFRFSPYILYYPDNLFRKQLRSLVKKYKKTCRNLGLNKILGEVHVVPPEEYRQNLRQMVQQCGSRTVILPETIYHHETERNTAIRAYNLILQEISKQYRNCNVVTLYDDFAENRDTFYSDETHANDKGHHHIAIKISDLLGSTHL